MARLTFSNLYFNPKTTLSITTIDIAESIPAEAKAEFAPQSPVLIKTIMIDGSNYIVYMATTKSN